MTPVIEPVPIVAKPLEFIAAIVFGQFYGLVTQEEVRAAFDLLTVIPAGTA